MKSNILSWLIWHLHILLDEMSYNIFHPVCYWIFLYLWSCVSFDCQERFKISKQFTNFVSTCELPRKLAFTVVHSHMCITYFDYFYLSIVPFLSVSHLLPLFSNNLPSALLSSLSFSSLFLVSYMKERIFGCLNLHNSIYYNGLHLHTFSWKYYFILYDCVYLPHFYLSVHSLMDT